MLEESRDRLIRNLVVDRDPEVHSGDLVFSGTRVPVATLVDYMKRGRSIRDFLEGFPTVERWQVEAYLELTPEAVEALQKHGHAHSH
jgi:uncharacterized protein (DUF433 family)